jgi:transposase-like protein
MTPPADTERYKNHRFPGEIISHGVWLSYRFTLSYRDVEDLLFERGIMVSHEATPPMVSQVWAGLRQSAATAASSAWRQIASGRGLLNNQW